MKRNLTKFIVLALTPVIFLSAVAGTANALRPVASAEKGHISQRYAALGTVGLVGIGVQGKRLLTMLVRNGSGVKVCAVDRYKDRQYISDTAAAMEKEQAAAGDGRCSSLDIRPEEPAKILNDPSIKAVVIATPSDTHYDLARQALLAGKHVLVEKPFVLKAEEAQELVDLARERGLVLMVGHVLFYSSNFQRLKAIVDSGILGDITGVEAELSNVRDRKRAYSANALEDLGYHLLYMVKSLLGESSKLEIMRAERFEDGEYGNIEHYELDMKYGPASFKLKVNRNHKDPSPSPQNVRVIKVRGSKFTATLDFSKDPSSIRIESANNEYLPAELSAARDMASRLSQPGEWKYNTPLDVEMRTFFEAILENGPNPSDGSSAAGIVKLIEDVNSLLAGSLKFTRQAPVPLLRTMGPTLSPNTPELASI